MVTVVKSLDPNSESKCETKAPLCQHMLLLATACSTLTSQSQQSQAIGGVYNKINEESRTTHLHNISLHHCTEDSRRNLAIFSRFVFKRSTGAAIQSLVPRK